MTTAIATRERTVMRRWVLFIGVLFVAQVGLWIGAAIHVAGDESHAVVDDYDARALTWDERRQRQRRSDATGWRADVAVETAADAELVVVLRDAQGRPVVGASLRATVFHNARAAATTNVRLSAAGDGTYRAVAPMTRAGKWTVQLVGERGEELLDVSTTVQVEG